MKLQLFHKDCRLLEPWGFGIWDPTFYVQPFLPFQILSECEGFKCYVFSDESISDQWIRSECIYVPRLWTNVERNLYHDENSQDTKLYISISCSVVTNSSGDELV